MDIRTTGIIGRASHSSYDRTVDFVFLCRRHPKIPASMTIQLSVDCTGP